MCDFVSWIEGEDGHVLYLTAKEVFHTKRGKALRGFCDNDQWSRNGYTDEYIGHGAIRWYYDLKGGAEHECTNFTNPKEFPKEIVEDIKRGAFRGLAIPAYPVQVLLVKPAMRVSLALHKINFDGYRTIEEEKAGRIAANNLFWDLFADPKNRRAAWR